VTVQQEPRGAADATPASDESLVVDGYDAVYTGGPDSPTLQRIWLQHASGAAYPAEFGHISFFTVDEAHTMARESLLEPGDRLVDLACGAGGPGLLIARDTGAHLTGVDLSPVGVAQARARSRRVGLADRCTFRVGSFDHTGLESSSAKAAMTVDAFQYAPDKRSALQEIGRVLQPGGRLLLVAFEVEPERVQGYPVIGVDPIRDYAPLLEEAGFSIDGYDETPGWHDRVTAAFQAVLDEPEALTAELGVQGYAALSLEVSITLGIEPYRRRVFAVATKR
jgi:SAM-dependent methyltransferase